ncbi:MULTISPECIES: amidase [Bacillaceae]|uniref:Aspartyl/glutamyl-tRNA amidotransferase subunit A n=1 Tax=Evansella alkalicola TaxID=745819 RepID=A0ABS6JY81_9BACI|nr:MULTISPECIES: amidase [Bacillaceae]MBU9723542.1 aspartyl/glutamyl-tRNA amidotransferase subunit A [Bacillus alkalicola]
MTELYTLTATELASLYRSKQVSPVEVTKSIFQRIGIADQRVNAYITTTPDAALKKAQFVEDDMMRGIYKSPLQGIPIGIKDNYYTAGVRTTAGSKILSDFIPDTTATSVKKLECAGGITLGKLNMHEFGGGLTNTNPFHGRTNNPWNTKYIPGGSSGGSAVALAAGLATLTTGTDTFGSIRTPAAMCGVYGLKPTYGLVSSKGVAPLAWSLDHAGPMARSVSDLALMLQEMAGYDPEDPASIKAPIPDYTENLTKGMKGVKIGVPRFFMEGLDHDIELLFTNALKKLEELGAEVKEITISELSMAEFAGHVITTGEASTFHYEWLQSRLQDYAEDVRIYFQSGLVLNTPQYVRAQQARRKLTTAFKKAIEDVDVLVGPTVPITTPPFQENWVEQNLEITKRCMPFTAPATLTGTPSLSVPMGLDSNRLPAGMQLIGNHLAEKLLLQVGKAWESTNPLG